MAVTNSTGGSSVGKFHYYTMGLIIPLLASMSPYIMYKIPIPEDKVTRPIKACIVGAIIAVACYYPMKHVTKEPKPLAQAILCGLLCAEAMAFGGGKFPSMAGITLWLFFYFHSVEH